MSGLFWVPAGCWAQNQLAPQPAATALGELAEISVGQFAVTYANGELTIKAQNAPLGEVLRAVCKQIGAELDAQTDAREPVLGVLGPGPAREVLTSLLSDAHLNYVIKRAADNPNVIAGITIFPQPKDIPAKRQVAEQEAVQPEGDSATPAPVSVKESMNQMMELLQAARSELASGASSDTQGGNEDTGGDGQVDMAAVLQLIEQQLKAVGNPSGETQMQASAAPPDSQPAVSGSPPASRRLHRHRVRH
jgi:hypothetical protein